AIAFGAFLLAKLAVMVVLALAMVAFLINVAAWSSDPALGLCVTVATVFFLYYLARSGNGSSSAPVINTEVNRATLPCPCGSGKGYAACCGRASSRLQ
ncbi:MAG: SEC-C domain-containing protein, partial [Methylobacillus sp.]|nr:SEC-C domain-containing protein [Methylobacillus sp.]